jgi:hypothetical protein
MSTKSLVTAFLKLWGLYIIVQYLPWFFQTTIAGLMESPRPPGLGMSIFSQGLQLAFGIFILLKPKQLVDWLAIE